MKKSISIWSFVGRSVKESMALAKEVGFEGIELAVEEDGVTGMNSTPKDWAEIKAYADELGLAISSVATGLYWTYSLSADDPKERERAFAVADMQFEMAKAFDADTILIVPGAVDAIFMPNFKVVPYDVVYERAFEAITTLKDKAEKMQIHIGVENVQQWSQFLWSPLEMRDFIDKIDSPYVGAYLDVGNVRSSGYPEHWIRILGKRIRKVHFKDFRREAWNLSGHVDLLAGDVNWPEVMKAFREIGYDGWAIAEMIPPYKHHSDQIIRNTYGSVKCIMGE